jgi:hypothetical protein
MRYLLLVVLVAFVLSPFIMGCEKEAPKPTKPVATTPEKAPVTTPEKEPVKEPVKEPAK